MDRRLTLALLLTLGCSTALHARAQVIPQPDTPPSPKPDKPDKPSRYPLRLHILAIDDTHRTLRMQPQWCSGSVPDVSGDPGPCSPGASLGGGDDDLSGAGRADLVTPPSGTIGLSFTYEGCSRIRVSPGFSGLEARWIKPGVKLQILLPTDEIADGEPRPRPCTLKVTPAEFVYLRLPNGKLVRVTQEAFAAKPSLRVFLSGGTQALERRNVISVKDLARSTPPQ